MLQDARGLLDEPAPLLGAGVQHGVELPLPDDHVHLAPEAGVAQQLLHVEQPARLAVDRVFAAAVAEQSAGDRDLRVLDREGAIRVVDGEDDLGATQRTLGRRAGEDDVLHLAAAERLRPLLAHHPRERIHDVRLARPVRADDTGHPLLEGEGGGVGEGLEALEGQALEIHRSPSRLADIGLRYPTAPL